MNLNELKPVGILSPFKHFCVSIGELPTAYMNSMSYYEMLVWFCKYLEETVIPAVNKNAGATLELQEKYVELKNYVDNYFGNLNVQEEINNKLDEMVETGILQEIISQYINSNIFWGFSSVQNMKNATNLIAGSFAKTTGYYEENDGGGASYYITNTLDETKHQELLQNGLYANLIEDNLNVLHYGIKKNDETFAEENINILQNLINKKRSGTSIYFPKGDYYISKPIDITKSHITLTGETETTKIIKTTNATIDRTIQIDEETTYNLNNIDFVVYIGKETSGSQTVAYNKINNIMLRGYDKNNSMGCLMIGCGYINTNNIRIDNVSNGCTVAKCFASNLEKIKCLNANKTGIFIDKSTSIYISSSYLNANYYAIEINHSRCYLDGVALDGKGGVPFYFHNNSYVSILNSRCETYISCVLAKENTIAEFNNCDFEGHVSDNVNYSYYFKAENNSKINIDNSIVRFQNYTENENPNNLRICDAYSNSLIKVNAYLNILNIPQNNNFGNGGNYFINDLNYEGKRGVFTPNEGITITKYNIIQHNGFVNIYIEGNSNEILPTTQFLLGQISNIKLPQSTIRSNCNTSPNNLYTTYNNSYLAISNTGDINITPSQNNQKYFVINIRYSPSIT